MAPAFTAIFTHTFDFLCSFRDRPPTRVDEIGRFFQIHNLSPLWLGLGVILLWILLVRSVRWRRYKAIHRRYGAKWDDGKGRLTPEEAQIVIQLSAHYDMPLVSYYAVAFASFKSFAIPSISRLLAATKEFTSLETVSRRYADTEILISTWMACPISGFLDPRVAEQSKALGMYGRPAEDPRAMIALARTNWIHSHYKISNDDYLYTLCLFVLQPITWAQKYGWRKLSPLEEHALYVFWAEIGKRMDIHDIPETLDGLIAWSKQYEATCMVPAESNHYVASYTAGELLSVAPEAFGIRKFGEKIIICLLDDIVRKAMMYPEQPWIYHAITYTSLSAMAFVQGWLLLPRRSKKIAVDTRIRTDPMNRACPRLHPTKWQYKPWYKPLSSGLGYYQDKLLVAIGWYAEMPGPHLKNPGYRIEEIGPCKFEKVGHEVVMKQAAKLQGCPVAGQWSLENRLEEKP